MKRILLIALLVGSGLIAFSQQIDKLEYYLDIDPGVGNGTSQLFSPADSITGNITIATSGLSLGFHVVYIRYRYNNGLWGNVESLPFFLFDPAPPVPPTAAALAAAEYFIDTDPGFGNGTAIIVTPGDSVLQNVSIPTSGLSIGNHMVYIRYKSQTGKWGNTYETGFYISNPNPPALPVAASLSKGEYFWDTDPGTGNGTVFNFASADSILQNISIPTNGMTLGHHSLYLRIMDQTGKWGNTDQQLIYFLNPATPNPPVAAALKNAEYFIDTDPGAGNGTGVTITPGDSAIQNISIPTNGLAGGIHTAFVRFRDSSGKWGHAEPVFFNLCNNATLITAEPNGVNGCVNGNASFSVTATGTSLTYQWQKNNISIGGATSATYNRNFLSYSDSGYYRVIVTGTCGADTSVPAFLAMNAAPAILSAPANQNSCQGANATFTVAASGFNNTYQWKLNNAPIAGATNTSYTVVNTQPSTQGPYKVTITNNCSSVTSGDVSVVFSSQPIVINTQPASHAICAGLPDTLKVVATGSNLAYQWQLNAANIPGATGAGYIMPNVQDNNAGSYQVVVSGTCGTPVTSQTASLTVNHVPATPSVINGNNSACNGMAQIYSIAPLATATSYTWALPNGWSGNSTGASISATPNSPGTILVNGNNACGSGAAQSLAVTINANFYACYCKTGLGGNAAPAITDVVFCTLSDLGRPSSAVINPNYGDYYSERPQTATVSKGGLYTITAGFAGNAIASVWIDYNRDGQFAAGEWTQITTGGSGQVSAAIQIPDNAQAGITGMRLRSRSSGNANGPFDACTAFADGETIDYLINITAPAAGQASGLQLSNITKEAIKVSFNRGTPKGTGGVIVVAREGAPIASDPIDNINYNGPATATVLYTDATLVPVGGGKVVYRTNNGTAGAKTFTLKGLNSDTRYYFQIYEFDSSAGGITYVGTPDPKADTATMVTAPLVKAGNLILDNITVTSMRAHWTNGSGSKRLVIVKALTNVQAPADNTTYVASNAFGNGSLVGAGSYVVYNGTDTTVTISNLQAGVKYYVSVFEYNSNNTNIDYAATGTFKFATTLVDFVCLPAVAVPIQQTFNGVLNISSGNLPTGWYISTPSLGQGDGTVTANGVYSFGVNGTTARSLGTLGTGSFGVKLSNCTGDTITSLVVQFDGRQWRKGANPAADSLILEFSTDATDFNSPTATWTRTNALRFYSLQAGPLSSAFNGNSVANVKNIVASVTGFSVPDGSYIWLRWSDNPTTADGLAVDNLNIIPFRHTFPAGGVLHAGSYADLNVAGGSLRIDSNVIIRDGMNIEAGAIMALDSSKFTLNGVLYGGGSFSGTPQSVLSVGGDTLDQHIKFVPGANTILQLLVTAKAKVTVISPINISASPAAGSVKVGTVAGDAVLNTGGFITLRSDSFNTATIPAIQGTINGDINVERWLQTDSSLRLIAHPFNTSLPVSQINDDVLLNVSGGATQNIWRYNPATANPAGITDLGSNDANWTPYSAVSQLWNSSEAIRLLKGPGAATLDMTGAINQGDFNVIVNAGANDSFVVIGNPYPAGLKLGQVLTNATDGPITLGTMAGSAIWTWDPTKGNAGAFTTLSGVKITNATLPISGVFVAMVPPSTSATLVYHESYKTITGSTKTFFRPGSAGEDQLTTGVTPEGLQLIITKGNKQYDNAFFYFNPNSVADLERSDAPKLSNPGLNFFSNAATMERLSVDTRPFEAGKRIGLGLTTGDQGRFTISAADYNLPEGRPLYLVDRQRGIEKLITKDFAYDFDVNKDPLSQGDRFYLRMGNTGAMDSEGLLQVDLIPNPADGEVTVRLNSQNDHKAVVRILSMTGRQMMYQEMPSTQHSQLTIPVNGLAAGIYMVEVTSEGIKKVKQLFKR